MSNLKKFFVSNDKPSMSASMEGLTLPTNNQLDHELRALMPSLESLIDYGTLINSDDPIAVRKFNRLTEAVLTDVDTTVSTESLETSLEGLGDMLGKVVDYFKSKPKGDKRFVDDNNVKIVRGVLSDIERFYLNQSWLARQSYVDGELDLGDEGKQIIQMAGWDGKTAALAYMDAMQPLAEAFSKWDVAVSSYGENIKSLAKSIETVAEDTDNDASAVIPSVNAAIRTFKALPSPGKAAGLLGRSYKLPNGGTLTFKDTGFIYSNRHGVTGPVKALDQSDVFHVAQAIKVALSNYVAGLEMGKEAVGTNYWSPRLSPMAEEDKDVRKVADQWWDLTYDQRLDSEGMSHHSGFMTDQLIAARTFVKWIEASIK